QSKLILWQLQQRDNPDHEHASLVLQFQQLLRREWEVKLFHVYREGNCLADHLAGRGHGLPLGTHPVMCPILQWQVGLPTIV
ncbi:hypothetical protein LINGRAHAP2_LOCUS6457, partial [Linum grandiflorum]